MDGLSYDARRRAPFPLAAGARPPAPLDLEDPFIGWTATLSITLLALFLRLWKLGTPHAFEFDETYYAKDAWSLWHFGYARDYIDNDGGVANKHILAGQTTDLWKPDASMVVHPEVGKWLIGLGEKVFGFTPLGWRVVPAIVGTLLILVMIRFVRRLTGSTLLGCVAGLLLSFDGLEFVLSRLALLDIFVAFFLLCAVHCLVLDRDWYRARMADHVARSGPRRRLGPGAGAAVPAVAAGLGGLLGPGLRQQVGGDLPARGVRAPRRGLVRGRPALVRGQPAPARRRSWPTASRRSCTSCWSAFVVYVATWTGWLMHSSQYVEYLSRHAVHPLRLGRLRLRQEHHLRQRQALADRRPAGRSTASPAWSRALESLLVLPPRRLRLPHPLPQRLHPHLRLEAAGWLLLNRPVGVDAADRHQARHRRAATPRRTATACARCCCSARRRVWWGGVPGPARTPC